MPSKGAGHLRFGNSLAGPTGKLKPWQLLQEGSENHITAKNSDFRPNISTFPQSLRPRHLAEVDLAGEGRQRQLRRLPDCLRAWLRHPTRLHGAGQAVPGGAFSPPSICGLDVVALLGKIRPS